jgi:hypothetical protein
MSNMSDDSIDEPENRAPELGDFPGHNELALLHENGKEAQEPEVEREPHATQMSSKLTLDVPATKLVAASRAPSTG